MRAKDLKVVVDHIVERMGDNAQILMFKGEDKHEPDFFINWKNDGDILKPRIVEDGCMIVPGVKAKL